MSVAAKAGSLNNCIADLQRLDSPVLAQALGVSLADARREIQIMLCRALRADKAYLLAHPEQILSGEPAERYRNLLVQRQAQVPLAYVLGDREFYGFAFEVTPEVLIPRPETELLVDLVLRQAVGRKNCRILDLGTGSGCIAITLAKLLPHAVVVGTDLSPAALTVAERNALKHQVGNLSLRLGSWFEPTGGERFDIIVSNPPYVAEHDVHLAQGDLRFEPRLALASGEDGLEALRTLIATAPLHLNDGGALLVEHGYDQANAVFALMQASGFVAVESYDDLAGIPRVAKGQQARP